MSELVAGCPRCRAQMMTFDVAEDNSVGAGHRDRARRANQSP